MRIAGIDGCRTGWVVILLNEALEPALRLCPTIADAATWVGPANRILIDMPIGFVDGGSEGRACEPAARRRLSPRRHSSVFTPPCRAALYAPLEEASSVNQSRTGKKLSLQTINILPKMRELDTFLRNLPPSQKDRWQEAHPEVVFASWHGQPLPHGKKTKEGRALRLNQLSRFSPALRDWLEAHFRRYPRKEVQVDDLVDAAALALTSYLIEAYPTGFRQLPEQAVRDSAGLLQRMVFWEGS